MVAWRVVLDNFLWVESINFVYILSEFGSWCGFNLLDFLETLRKNELLLLLGVVRESFGELVKDVLEDIGWGFRDESLKSWQVAAHLQNTLQGFFGLLFEVLSAGW